MTCTESNRSTSHTQLRAWLAAGLALLAGAMAAQDARAASPGHAGHSSKRVVDLPVSFAVHNTNRSKVVCLSDGAAYVVRGHLVAPRAALAPAHSADRAVTIYMHGSTNGEQVIWRSRVPGYNWARGMAKAGHVSVTFDRLGFGTSGIPDGMQVCPGSEADVTHQIVAALRSGDYTVARRAAPRFGKVALAGVSGGGLAAQIEAYSFQDIDALIQLATTFDQGFAPAFTLDLVANPDPMIPTCARGGVPKYPDGHGPRNYAYLVKQRLDLIFYNADPATVATFARGWEREPCSTGFALGPALLADALYLRDITVPVLIAMGDHDAIFPPPFGERQRALYTGSTDTTLVTLPNTGHAIPLERTAPAARAAVSDWLRARGF